MGQIRLGAASMFIEFSDEAGLRVDHGTDGVTLLHVEADRLESSDWDDLWAVLERIRDR